MYACMKRTGVCVGVWLLGVGDGELRDRGVGLDEEKKLKATARCLMGKHSAARGSRSNCVWRRPFKATPDLPQLPQHFVSLP